MGKKFFIEVNMLENNKIESKVITDLNQLNDGYHTMEELYYHRMMLFAVICNQNKDLAWKSWKHYDGTMYEDYFIVGITTPLGDYTYHYHKDYWGFFNVRELDKGKSWDGHQPKDIIRLLTLNNDYRRNRC